MPVNSFEDYPMSWRPVLDRSRRSIYQTLAKQLEDDIVCGVLKPGTKLPPQRELADFLDVNLSTVTKAFRVCEQKGLLSATVGNGTYVAYDALTSGQLLLSSGGAVVDMGATVPEPSGNPFLAQMLREMTGEFAITDIFSYPEPQTLKWQKDAVVRLLARCGYKTEMEQILSANGGQNALSAILAALFHRGDRIAVDDHTYPGIKTAAAMFGVQLVPVAGTDDGMNTEELEAVCKSKNIRGIYIIPACHNPTTVTISPESRKEIARIARKYGCLVIEDGTYQLMKSGIRAVSDYIREQSIYVLTLSKVIAPGLRMAYLSVPVQYKKAVSDALYSLNVSVVPLMAELSARIIASGQFEDILKAHKENTRRRNAVVNHMLSGYRCFGRDTDMFRWLLLPERFTGAAFEQLAASNGVLLHSAEKFAVGKTPPTRAVRLSICTPKELNDLEHGINIVKHLLTS